MFKTANIGSTDRIVRFVLGALLLVAPFLFMNTTAGLQPMHWLMVIVGAVLIFTAFVRFCPLYRLVGTSTCRTS